MILFINVFITKSFATSYDRGRLPTEDRLTVFKYSLASLAVIPWSKVIIYCELDKCYEGEDLEGYIKELFPNVSYYRRRLDKQLKWQRAMEEVFSLPDQLVWFTCNDDHIFIDYDLDVLKACERRLLELLEKQPYASCYISHWAEMLCHANYGQQYPILTKAKEYFEVEWANIDSIQIVSKEVLKHWWFSKDYGNEVFLIRTDGNIPGKGPEYIHIDQDLSVRTLIPLREQARHFDGYCRPYMPGGSSDINRCPPLFIPPGFFEKQIKISYCKELIKSGYVNINPVLANYSTVDRLGADSKMMLEDLPLFWRDRIVEIDFGPEIDREILIGARNKAVQMVAQAERDI
jgi:hypothetical protein